MLKILGKILPENKSIYLALTTIYGIGRNSSNQILKQLDIAPNIIVDNLTKDQVYNIQNYIENMDIKLEGKLKQQISINIKRLMDICCFRGSRHIKGLPTRGQRTRTNCKNCKKVINFIKTR